MLQRLQGRLEELKLAVDELNEARAEIANHATAWMFNHHPISGQFKNWPQAMAEFFLDELVLLTSNKETKAAP